MILSMFLAASCGTVIYYETFEDVDNLLFDEVIEQVDSIVCVAGGNDENEMKFAKYHRCLELIEKRNQKELVDKMVVFYNKFSNKTSRDITNGLAPVVGGIPRFEGVQMAGIAGRAAVMDVFEDLKKVGE